MLRKISLGFLCAALLAACGHARPVQRTQYGGVLALEGDRNKAMENAHRMMSEHCGPGNYTILREGEVVVGQDQVARADTEYDKRGDSTVASSSTREATEWRVEYQCGGAPPPPAAPPPPSAAPSGPPPSNPPPPGY